MPLTAKLLLPYLPKEILTLPVIIKDSFVPLSIKIAGSREKMCPGEEFTFYMRHLRDMGRREIRASR